MKNYLQYFLLCLMVIATSLCHAQTPTLWGMTTGGTGGWGSIYQTNSSGSAFVNIDLNGYDGADPQGSLIRGNDGLFYGLTYFGGPNGGGETGEGVLFSYDASTGTVNVLYQFADWSLNPLSSVIQASDGNLYGMTEYGGIDMNGMIFEYNLSTSQMSEFYAFGGSAYDGGNPSSHFIQATNGLLYATSSDGGHVLSLDPGSRQVNVLSGLSGYGNVNSLIQASNGLLYGTTDNNGTYSYGTIFSYNTSTGALTYLYNFGNDTDGQNPGNLIQATNGLLYGTTGSGGANGEGTIFSYNISTGIETDLHDFGSGTDGSAPFSAPIQASDGQLYGTTSAGGVNSYGTVFHYNISTGIETVIHNFADTEENDPHGSLLEYDTISVTPSLPSICLGGNTTFTASGSTAYTWSPSTGLSATTGAIVIANPTTTTTYTVTGQGNGQTISCNVVVTVTDNLDVTASANPSSYCPGASSTLKASGANTYTWSPATGLSATTGSSVTADPTTSTTYTVTGTSSGGCYSTATVAITVNPLVFATASPAVYCPGGSTTLRAYDGSTFTWSPATGLSATTGVTVIANPSVTTTYTVTGSGLCPGSAPVVVTIAPSLQVSTTIYQADYCQGFSATITAAGANSYTWSPAAGLNVTTGDYIKATPSVTTTYTVTGTDGCTGTATVIDSVIPNPIISAVALPASYCVSGSSTITASGGNYVYGWNPCCLRLSLNSSGSVAVATPTVSTTYTVSAVDSNGCVGSTTVSVTVGAPPVISALATPSSYCSGGNSTLTASGGSTYTWSPSTGLSATTGSSVTANPTVTTTYTVTGTNSSGCSATNTVTVTVTTGITVAASATPASYCSGGSSNLTASGGNTYTWSPSTALSATTGSSVTANPTITTTYTVMGTSSGGCSATKTVTITVNPNPTINASEKPSSYCAGGSSVFLVSGGTTYTWSPSIGLSATTGSSVTASPTVSTVYTVTGKNVYGCSGTKSGKVTVNALPIVSITPTSLALCNGSSSTLKVSGATTYAWSPSAGLSNTTGTSLTVNPTVTTTYTVSGTNSSGCIGTKTVTVTVNPVPVLSASESPSSICAGSSSVLKVAGATTYTWAPATGLSATTGTSVTADPSITTTYIVTGTNTFGCSAKKSGKLTVNVCGTGGSDMVDEDSSGTTTSGIDQLPGFSNQISVYPNPANNSVFVKINSLAVNVDEWSLQLIDVLGRTLYTIPSLNYSNEIDLTNLPGGVYFIAVVNKTGKAIVRVVKIN